MLILVDDNVLLIIVVIFPPIEMILCNFSKAPFSSRLACSLGVVGASGGVWESPPTLGESGHPVHSARPFVGHSLRRVMRLNAWKPRVRLPHFGRAFKRVLTLQNAKGY